MRKAILWTVVFACLAPARVAAQFTEWEDGQSKEERPVKEVKFIAGQDKVWFDQDDAVYHYFTVEYDRKGRMKKKFLFLPGGESQGYWRYVYNANGRLAREVFYNGKGRQVSCAQYEYNGRGDKERVVMRDPKGAILRYTTYEYGHHRGKSVKDVEYKGPGQDGRWFTPDDEIDRYHSLEYDNLGRLVRAKEYHSGRNGRGEDNLWFTPDDVVSSVKTFTYDSRGKVCRTNKYIDAGQDGRWFTTDDVPQYYTIRYYEKVS